MKLARDLFYAAALIAGAALLTACSSKGASSGTNAQNSAASVTDASGESSLISMIRVTTGLTGCDSGSGLQINSGLDTNRNETLDQSEIQQTQILCDGKDGAVGAAGVAGANGHGMVFSITSASTSACPAGGSVIIMATDSNDSGAYESGDADPQSMTLCNGAPGAAGATGAKGATGATGAAGKTPAYTPILPIMPCGDTVADKEVLLRLSDGEILSSFSDSESGSMTRLTFLPDGTYIDTDDSNCQFTLATATNGRLRSISWMGQTQMTWAMIAND